jgi:hypothetical protein
MVRIFFWEANNRPTSQETPHFLWNPKVRLGRRNTKETGNRKATAISKNCYQPELNTSNWM